MPLVIPKYSLAAIKDWEELTSVSSTGISEVNTASATLINCMLAAGVKEKSDENLDEVWMRLALLQSLTGAIVFDAQGTQPYYLTYADVKRHIGLITEIEPQPLIAFWTFLKNQMAKSWPKNEVFKVANGGKTFLEISASWRDTNS